MTQPFPIGIFAALGLCLVFFVGLAWHARKAWKISPALRCAMAATFVAIPLIGMVFLLAQMLAR